MIPLVIRRAGEVIPKVLKVVDSRCGKEFAIPKSCPACSGKVIKEKEEDVAYRCINPSCPAQLERGLLHFASRGALDCAGCNGAFSGELLYAMDGSLERWSFMSLMSRPFPLTPSLFTKAVNEDSTSIMGDPVFRVYTIAPAKFASFWSISQTEMVHRILRESSKSLYTCRPITHNGNR